MEKKMWNRIIALLLVCIIGSVIWGVYLKNTDLQENIVITTQNEEDLINEDYSKIGINPNDYSSVWDYLDQKWSMTWTTVDIINENFVICSETKDWNILYVPFYQNDIQGVQSLMS